MPTVIRRYTRFAAAVVLIALLVVPSNLAFGGTDDVRITVTTTTRVAELSSGEIALAELTTDPADGGRIVFGLRWRLHPEALIPTWELQLFSEVPGLLPTGTLDTVVSRLAPSPDHTYRATLSYDSQLQVLAMQVFDLTDDRVIHFDAFEVDAVDGPMYAAQGTVSPYYTPVGTSWTPGVLHGDGRFVTTSQFDTRNQAAYIRIATRGPLPPGTFRLFLDTAGDEHLLATLAPTDEPAMVPLRLSELPLGPATLRVDYMYGEQIVPHDSRTITLGRLDFWVHPLTVDRDAGVVRTSLSVQGAEPYADELSLALTASVFEMVWDDASKTFTEKAYFESVPVFFDALDLALGSAELSFDVPVPGQPGNWRLEIGTEPMPAVTQHVEGNTRVFSTHAPAAIESGDAYTFIVFPDTQHFAQSYPHIFTRMTDWVTASAAELKIAAVLHMGDITNNNADSEWTNAFTSLSLLHDVVPYMLAVGNHDMTRSGGQVAERGLTKINDYFPVEAAKRYSNLAGTMTEGSLENHYSLLSVGSDDYLIISLEFGPPDEALAWANEVADRYPDHRLILITHSYLSRNGKDSLSPETYPLATNPATTVNAAPQIWDEVLYNRANSFMVLSGHTSPPAPVIPHRVRRALTGQPVFDLLFDFQSEPSGGNGWLGIVTIYPDNRAEAWVYSPYLGEYANAATPNGFASHIIMNLETGSVRRLVE